jgi:hypothetical protein
LPLLKVIRSHSCEAHRPTILRCGSSRARGKAERAGRNGQQDRYHNRVADLLPKAPLVLRYARRYPALRDYRLKAASVRQ